MPHLQDWCLAGNGDKAGAGGVIIVPVSLLMISPAGKPGFFFFLRFYLVLERGDGREGERERNIDQLPLVHTVTKRATQACTLTKNQTGDLSFCRMTPNQLSHTRSGQSQTSYMIAWGFEDEEAEVASSLKGEAQN